LIGIAGPSCAGKTELSKWLAMTLPAEVVSLDSYYRELAHLSFEERARVNFDEPASLDDELLVSQLKQLARGEHVARPIYDFSTHSRTNQAEFLEPAPFIIVEGLFSLHWEPVRRLLTLAVYISTPDEVCFERRLERDVRERGRTVESVTAQYDATVRPMCEMYIVPTERHADVVASGIEPLDASGARILRALEERLGGVRLMAMAAGAGR
jgi:uridine kinase